MLTLRQRKAVRLASLRAEARRAPTLTQLLLNLMRPILARPK